MRTRTAIVGTVIGAVMVVASAAPVAAATGNGNLFAAAGVTFGANKIDTPKTAEPADAAPELKFTAAIADAFAPRGTDEPHMFGGGLRTGGYSYGIGLLLRYWFSDIIFFDLGFSHHGYFSYLSYNNVSASVQYVFKKIDTSDVVIVRIYAGGGVTISHWSYDLNVYGPGVSSTSFGGHGLVGAELVFKELPKLAVGADAGFYTSHNNFGLHGFGGLGMSFYGIWYFK